MKAYMSTNLIERPLSYLGKVILSGSSFATLRNLADYGATLCFDDAEGLTQQNSKKLDPDKMNLILAGNRKGNTATVMEPGPGQQLHMRHVNSFSARCFSSTQSPYPTLASRSIIVPLRRTADRAKMNADPGRAKVSPKPWNWAQAHEMGCRFPVGVSP
jgi:hypothetical protein